MGRMKDKFIDQMNNQPDDTDWNYEEEGGISPREYDEKSGKYLFVIKSIKDDCNYRIWADTYKQAVEMLPMIESF